MHYTNGEFEKILEKSREIVKDKSLDECPCTQVCEWHGKCFECVKIHRVKRKHIPQCLQPLFFDQIESLSKLVERKTIDDRPIVK